MQIQIHVNDTEVNKVLAEPEGIYKDKLEDYTSVTQARRSHHRK